MRQRIQFYEKSKYSRIVARIPADLERACRRLVQNEGWELGDLYRSLILLGACGSFLTLRSLRPGDSASDRRFPSVLKQYLGRRAYAPSFVFQLDWQVALTYVRAGLLVYVTSEQELADSIEAPHRAQGIIMFSQ